MSNFLDEVDINEITQMQTGNWALNNRYVKNKYWHLSNMVLICWHTH